MSDPEFTPMRVDALRVSDMVDLEGDTYADPHAGTPESNWEFEYGAIIGIERETATCIRLDFHTGDSVGFPVDHILLTHRLTEADLSWTVTDSHNVPIGAQCPRLGAFDNEDDAAAFIDTLPGADTGRYNLDPPVQA